LYNTKGEVDHFPDSLARIHKISEMTTSTIDHIQKEILSEFALRRQQIILYSSKQSVAFLLGLSIPTDLRP